MTKQIVHRIEEGMDRREVLCTTYQQRNFYRQLSDGFFSRNDTFNYVLHHQVAIMAARKGGAVLDVCCGRGLMLPLLRYHAADIGSYTGIDIKPTNATWRYKRVTDGKPLEELGTVDGSYYPFPVRFVEGNVARADEVLRESDPTALFDLIIYTASIEHMNPEDGARSLVALRRLAAPGSTMVLTSPNTPPEKDGYDTRYRAHVYEWSLGELREGLAAAGWRVNDVWGLDMEVGAFKEAMAAAGFSEQLERLRKFVPQEWLIPALAPIFAEQSSEVGLLCEPDHQGTLL